MAVKVTGEDMRSLSFVLSRILLFCLIAAPALAGIHTTDVRYAPGMEEITFRADEPIAIKKSFLLASPPRLVIDCPALAHGNGVGLSAEYGGQLMKDIRFGQFNASTSRLVIDLAQKNLQYQVSARGNMLQVVLQSKEPQPAARAPSSPLRPQTAPASLSRKPVAQEQAQPLPIPSDYKDLPLPAAKPKHRMREAQKPIIVIDAGHGGKDSGALGKRGSIEKRLTLSYALTLRKALLQTGRYRVVLTRRDDRYLFLKERVAIAKQNKGDAFISIHADSNPSGDARGLSVYTLSEQASDEWTAALAAQENKADIIGGMDLSTEDETVANILIDLAQRQTNNKSSDLAERLIASVDRSIPLITNPHRFAGFRVLKAPDIPSILVEIGFLSNHEDEKRVNTRKYREKVAESIVKALDDFFDLR